MKFTRKMTGNSMPREEMKGLFIIVIFSSYNKCSRDTRTKEEVNLFKLNSKQISEYGFPT